MHFEEIWYENHSHLFNGYVEKWLIKSILIKATYNNYFTKKIGFILFLFAIA